MQIISQMAFYDVANQRNPISAFEVSRPNYLFADARMLEFNDMQKMIPADHFILHLPLYRNTSSDNCNYICSNCCRY